MSYLSLVLGIIKIVQTLIQWGSDNRMFQAGANEQLTKSLLETARMTADAKKLEEWIMSQPDVNVDRIMREYYTRD